MMVPRDQRLLVWSALASSAAMLVAAVFGFEQLLAFAAPLLVLALPLLAGRYPGEERLARLAAGGRDRRPRASGASVPVAWLRPRRLLVRGGRLIAASLAVRPPPAPAAR